jgi:hypothetical protein
MVYLEKSQSEYALFECLQGDIFFHPNEQRPLVAEPRERKKPLEEIASGYTNSGFAPAGRFLAPMFPVYQCVPMEGYFRQQLAVGETPSTER